MTYIIFGLVLMAMFGTGCGFAHLLNRTENIIVIQIVSLVARGLMLAPLMFVLIATFVLAGAITPQMLTVQDKSFYIVIAVGVINAIIAIAIEENTFTYLCHHQFVGNMVSAAIPAT